MFKELKDWERKIEQEMNKALKGSLPWQEGVEESKKNKTIMEAARRLANK
ncbi:MAG: hypothetical protein MRECE_4c004 [Mycoplasmataceae bacterium CE_OT135]|nr:MAG: hypothetical protein MRECE_4c004 [Mycoplasmataceae bacterium CE_OT135]